MAQSDNTRLTVDGAESRESGESELSKGEARLVIRESGVTVTIEGNADEVRRRYHEYMANTLDTTVDEFTASADEYPHPEFGEGLVSADEFYDSE